MSKIGKKTIEIPSGVTVNIDNGKVNVTGPKGTLSFNFEKRVKVNIDNNIISLEPSSEKNYQYWGLYRTLFQNAITGVTNGAQKKLEFHGIGYKASVQNGDLVLNVGYSHPVVVKKVNEIDYNVTDNIITILGIDKVLVGDIAAKIRAIRKPDPYKGKGIRYQGEVIIKKETKSA